MLTKAIVETTYRAIRTAAPGAAVSLRHAGNTYSGTRGVPIAAGMELGRTGSQMTGDGAVRLLASELKAPFIKPGDEVTIQDAQGTWRRYYVTGARYDHVQATMLVEYSAEGM